MMLVSQEAQTLGNALAQIFYAGRVAPQRPNDFSFGESLHDVARCRCVAEVHFDRRVRWDDVGPLEFVRVALYEEESSAGRWRERRDPTGEVQIHKTAAHLIINNRCSTACQAELYASRKAQKPANLINVIMLACQ